MTDSAAEYTAIPRIPADKFEAELFRREIQREIDGWYRNTERVAASVGAEPDSEGRYRLSILESSEDILRIMPTAGITGSIWLAEREYPASESYRVIVAYEVEMQGGETFANQDFPPPNHWRSEING